MLQSFADRRAAPRIDVQIEALVIVPHQFHARVTILDRSEGGCRIRLRQPLNLPQRFVIEFDGMAYLCERRWANAESMGVQFIDILSRAQRRELSGLLATARL